MVIANKKSLIHKDKQYSVNRIVINTKAPLEHSELPK